MEINQTAPATNENKYKFNGIEKLNDFGANLNLAFYRNYDAAIGRWGQIDPKPDMGVSSYSAMGNNLVLYSDMLGDTVKYANDEMRKMVESYTQEKVAKTDKKGNTKMVKNSNYSADYAAKVSELSASKTVFNFTNDASLLTNKTSLGEIVHDAKDDNKVNVVVNTNASNESLTERIAYKNV